MIFLVLFCYYDRYESTDACLQETRRWTHERYLIDHAVHAVAVVNGRYRVVPGHKVDPDSCLGRLSATLEPLTTPTRAQNDAPSEGQRRLKVFPCRTCLTDFYTHNKMPFSLNEQHITND